jgi:hypothetical protein
LQNWSYAQGRAVAELLAGTPWADISNAAMSVEIVLALLLRVTAGDFATWEEAAENAGYENEYDVTDADLSAMPGALRRGYVARLIRNVALDFGVGTEYGGDVGVRRGDRDSLAFLVRRFCDIAAEESPEERLIARVNETQAAIDRLPDASARRRGWYVANAELAIESLLIAIRAQCDGPVEVGR